MSVANTPNKTPFDSPPQSKKSNSSPIKNQCSIAAMATAVAPKKIFPSLALIGTGIKKTMPEQPTLSEIQRQ